VLPRILVKRFAFDIEVLANAHRLGYEIVDAPVRIQFRRDIGRIRFRDAMNILIDTLAIFYRMHILRYYDGFDEVKLHELSLPESVEGLRVAEAVRKS
jgi:hypothetical protein